MELFKLLSGQVQVWSLFNIAIVLLFVIWGALYCHSESDRNLSIKIKENRCMCDLT